MNRDEEQLKLLTIFHYVVAGCAAFFALFPALYLVLGLIMLLVPASFKDNSGQPPPVFVAWIFIAIGSVFIFLGWTFAAFVVAAGRFLARRRHYTFCLVMAAVECLFMPFGTVLGVFTIVVLCRESVKPLFVSRPA